MRQVNVLEIPGMDVQRDIHCTALECQSVIAVVEDEGFSASGDGAILSITLGRSSDVLCDRRSCQTITRVVWDASSAEESSRPRAAQTLAPSRKTPKRPAPVPALPLLRHPGPSSILTEEMLELLMERWESFRIEKIRKRGTIAVGLRFNVFMRDGFKCRYCGASADAGALLHADHVIPESKGGPTTLENLVTACIDCNLGKSDKDLPE